MKLIYKSWCVLLCIILASCANNPVEQKEITLPVFFSDNMVLQQNTEVPFFGEATPNTAVTITTSWNKKEYSVTTDANGKFSVNLTTIAYGGPYEITLQQGTEEKKLANVLLGEVWLCSGQSNMEMPLAGWGKIKNFEEEIANAKYPNIRLLQATHVNSAKPLDTLMVDGDGWMVCSPETISQFSSTAYFFARKVYEETKVPVGLLHSSWGGTVVEAWTSAEALKTVHDFDSEIAALEATDAERQKIEEENAAKLKRWNEEVDAKDRGMQNAEAAWAVPAGVGSWETMQLPEYWENSSLGEIDGVVWFTKKVTLGVEALNSNAYLHFYADDNDKVWVNGTFIGETVGYDRERNYKLPHGVLQKGENTITIRVFDGASGGGIYGGANELYLQTGDTKMSLAGNWHYKLGVGLDEVSPVPYIPAGQNRPTVLYNAMIHPILQYKIKGVIWYQGESNAERAAQYRKLFPLLIKDWRKQFNNADMPFYFVQLANYQARAAAPGPSDWAELREAQLLTLKTVPNTGMAVTIDIGEEADIHPKNKQEVGARLAAIALAKLYGKNVPFSGPIYKGFEQTGNTITVTFDYADGLKTKDGVAVKGFEIAGADKKFYWANATIEGDKIIVSSPKVVSPIAVRYGWANNPDVNLYNQANLPASPFRTDDWPGVTLAKQ